MFAPLVVLVRNIVGQPRFVKLRGKAIVMHSKAITSFCNQIGIDRNQRQGWMRLARDNGKRLGLLA